MNELTTLIIDKRGPLDENSKEALKAERERIDYIESLQEQEDEPLH